MQREIVIDTSFISKWSPQYDEYGIGDDYVEYENIIQEVAKDVCQQGTVSKPTFVQILDWKAPRVKGILRLDDFGYYTEGIKQALSAPENNKLPILDDLYGIGVPLGSTILHFIYPSIFPIMDIRVAEVLYYSGYLKAKSRTLNNYDAFRKVALSLAQESKSTLRDLDKALFAYHKKELEAKLGKEKISGHCNR